MCGIAGYLTINSNASVDVAILEKMQRVIAHRGPNGYRAWVDPLQQFGIVHRRLSILDLSDAGFQPMFDDEKKIAVCCNGEIYNFKALKKELESCGYIFNSGSDTEVIVYAYKKWGIQCLDKLEGMFAIVIADLERNEFFFVRDRIGIKPLYFSTQGGNFSFASEIKALWQLPWMKKEINTQALYHYLTYMVTPAPSTLYNQVYKIPAGYYLKIDAQKKYSVCNWYNPLKPKTRIDPLLYKNEETIISHLRTLLRNSVEKKLIADVPVGAFLSGGIDSSLIVALMSEYTDKVKTFNVSFADGQEYSEVMWARKVARKFNTDHHEIVISEKEAFEFFQQMVYLQDEPLADCVCIPLYYVSKLLKDAGVTVALVGEGSDELFCGYSTYANYIDFYNNYWYPAQHYMPAFAKKGAYKMASGIHPEWHHLDMLKNLADDRALFWGGATVFTESTKHQFFKKHTQRQNFDEMAALFYPELDQHYDSHAIVKHYIDEYRAVTGQNDFLTSMIYLELKQRLPELLLMRVDKMTMATSVEARVPFLDHLLVEYALKIPTQLKYNNGITKYILKKVAETLLPHDIIYRKKIGFAAPTARWFKTGAYFKPYFESMLENQNNPWQEYIDLNYAKNLFEKNQHSSSEYSVHLWTLQNLMACDIG